MNVVYADFKKPHPRAEEVCRPSNSFVTNLRPDMTIGEAAKLIGISAEDVVMCSGDYAQRLEDHWKAASEYLKEARSDIEKMKAIHEFYQSSKKGEI